MADTHVCEDRNRVLLGVKPGENFAQARKQLLAGSTRPAGLFIAGDCACLEGTPGDYAALLELVRPIRAAGVPLHLVLGNHDQRENFRKAMAPLIPVAAAPSPVKGKFVSVLETPLANWFLLDSLDPKGGILGQCSWLGWPGPWTPGRSGRRL